MVSSQLSRARAIAGLFALSVALAGCSTLDSGVVRRLDRARDQRGRGRPPGLEGDP